MNIIWLAIFGVLFIALSLGYTFNNGLDIIPSLGFALGAICVLISFSAVLVGIPEGAEAEITETSIIQNYSFDTTKEFSVQTKEYSTVYDKNKLIITGYDASGTKLSIQKNVSYPDSISYIEHPTDCSYQVIRSEYRRNYFLFFYITETRYEHRISCPKEHITREKVIS